MSELMAARMLAKCADTLPEENVATKEDRDALANTYKSYIRNPHRVSHSVSLVPNIVPHQYTQQICSSFLTFLDVWLQQSNYRTSPSLFPFVCPSYLCGIPLGVLVKCSL
jgi:hypothetical protein